ncbi:MBL fold metallo-hydrolase [Clostridium ihumii]|uniref:MBL fold metallo-hydrolase n=1 Tax=Clostridium ihumii TaxID=1470356 RepID=UPI003D3470D1
MKFCPLFSGSSGNSIFVGTENTKILIDAGVAGKNIEAELRAIGEEPSSIDGIFVTHEHSDHIKSVGVMSRKHNIPIYANELTWEAMLPKIGKVKEENIKLLDTRYTAIKDIEIENFRISHDAVDPRGYLFNTKKGKAAIATDLGCFSDEIKDILNSVDVLLLESNHDVEMLKFGPYPYVLKRRILSEVGHLSNEACGNAILELIKSGRKRIYLGHLSKTNNYPQLAYETVSSILKENNVNIGEDVYLSMANRSNHSEVVNL